MRIATLGNAAAVHTRRWVEHFRGRGHEVRLWSLEPGPPGVPVERLPALPVPRFARYPLAAPALAGALAAFRPDLVDAHYVPNYGLLAAMVGRHPLSVAAWGSDLLISAPRTPLHRARARFVLRRADLILVDARNLARAARALGAREDRLACVPWGVPLERFRPATERTPGLLLSTRMHEPVYGIRDLIEGVAPVLRGRAETRLVIAGEGSERGALERLAALRLPTGRYQFVGRLEAPELARWMADAEIYLSASRSDSTSLSLLEAMASGAIPVVSDIEGNREWVGEGEGARLFEAGEPASLTRALEEALSDPEWATRARARNRRVVEARGDHSRNMAEIESRFAGLVAGRL